VESAGGRYSLPRYWLLKGVCTSREEQRLYGCDPADVSIGHAAASLGFTHVGQFAADYRRAFDESPSDTQKKSPE
jgi:AraC-like DNA-binding protein